MQDLKTEIPYALLINESLLKFMNEGLLVLNSEDRIEVANASAIKLLGYQSDRELLGKLVRELYVFPDALENLLAVQSQGEAIDNWENTFIKADGSTFSGACSLRVVDEKINHQRTVKLLLFRDITEAKKHAALVEEQKKNLERSNKELDQFAYIVSHDLKAPLRAISNLSVWLEEDLGNALSDENKSNLTMLRGRVSRMEALINGILEYSRVGRTEVACESVDVFLLVKEALELLAPPQQFKIDISKQLPVIDAPRVMLLQVFTNLISNAIKYNDKQEGLIRIDATEREDSFEFSVSDNGPGIAPEYHEKIFMIFQTLQSRDKFESTGIGLTIVKRILKARGGKVWVESSPGNGSKFIFSWPKIDIEQSKTH
jgi:PAS domain S-box-containing protein